MVRQWQQFFYEGRYAATPLLSPDFAKLAEAYGIKGLTVSKRSQLVPTLQAARSHQGPALINFCVEAEDSVYPMVPSGADLHAMIRRPSPLVERPTDD
jgi:acetolactate synthase-1/2/3 large subunit